MIRLRRRNRLAKQRRELPVHKTIRYGQINASVAQACRVTREFAWNLRFHLLKTRRSAFPAGLRWRHLRRDPAMAQTQLGSLFLAIPRRSAPGNSYNCAPAAALVTVMAAPLAAARIHHRRHPPTPDNVSFFRHTPNRHYRINLDAGALQIRRVPFASCGSFMESPDIPTCQLINQAANPASYLWAM